MSFNQLSASSDCIPRDRFEKLYASTDALTDASMEFSTESSSDHAEPTNAKSMYEKLTGKPYEPNNVNFIEVNIHAIFQAVENNDRQTFKKLFNFLSEDPVNLFLLLQEALKLCESSSEIETYIYKLTDKLYSKYPEYEFYNISKERLNELKWDIKREHLGTSLTAFRNTVGFEFYQDKADLADNWIFDIFTAIENSDIEELEKLLGHVEFGDFHNMLLTLGQARIMSEAFIKEESNNSFLVNKMITKAEKTLRKMKSLPKQPALNKDVLGYCKEHDHKLISHFQEMEKEEARLKSITKTLMLLQSFPARFLFADQSHLQPRQLKNEIAKIPGYSEPTLH